LAPYETVVVELYISQEPQESGQYQHSDTDLTFLGTFRKEAKGEVALITHETTHISITQLGAVLQEIKEETLHYARSQLLEAQSCCKDRGVTILTEGAVPAVWKNRW
jgi:hypothetical protein